MYGGGISCAGHINSGGRRTDTVRTNSQGEVQPNDGMTDEDNDAGISEDVSYYLPGYDESVPSLCEAL